MVGHCRIEAKLGEGGMGVVYRAQDLKLNRPVAVKFLFNQIADDDARRRFQREAQTASSLNHPHIVTLTTPEKPLADSTSSPNSLMVERCASGPAIKSRGARWSNC